MLGLGIGLWNNVAATSGGGAVTGTTWNPADKGTDITLSGGNLIMSQTTGFEFVRAILFKTTGKWYVEGLINNAGGGLSHQGLAIIDGTYGVGNALPGTGGVFLCDLGIVTGSGSTAGTTPSGSIVDGTVVQAAVDCDNNRVWFGINNTFGGSPAGGTGASTTALTSFYIAAGEAQGQVTLRTTAASQTYSPPAGFTAWG